MTSSIQKYVLSSVPEVCVTKFVIARAVEHLEPVEALALIRGAFSEDDGGFATVENARTIYKLIRGKEFPE